jgi:hypothetical protein
MTLGNFRFFATLDLEAAAARRRHAAAARHPEIRAACFAAARDRLRDARHWRLRRIAALAAEAELDAALASGWAPEPEVRAP